MLTPSSLHIGMISLSKSRLPAFQRPWYTQNCLRPWSRAYWLALETTQAGVSDTPRYRTLPWTTKWLRLCISSGI